MLSPVEPKAKAKAEPKAKAKAKAKATVRGKENPVFGVPFYDSGEDFLGLESWFQTRRTGVSCVSKTDLYPSVPK